MRLFVVICCRVYPNITVCMACILEALNEPGRAGSSRTNLESVQLWPGYGQQLFARTARDTCGTSRPCCARFATVEGRIVLHVDIRLGKI